MNVYIYRFNLQNVKLSQLYNTAIVKYAFH